MGRSFWRRASEPSEREQFLLAALAVHNITPEMVDQSLEAKATDFLGSLSNDAELKAARSELAVHKDRVVGLEATLTKAGFEAKDWASSESFAAAVKDKIETRASEQALEISAARGIKPIASTASASSVPSAQAKTIKRADMAAMSPGALSEFFRTGGKLID